MSLTTQGLIKKDSIYREIGRLEYIGRFKDKLSCLSLKNQVYKEPQTDGQTNKMKRTTNHLKFSD